MSDRLATSPRDISHYHISLEEAHTLLAQASLAVLLRDPDANDHTESGPLARYAADHWVTHAQVENVASRVRDGMEYLFDLDKPYFEAWARVHDIDPHPGFGPDDIRPDLERGARPLYYAALCGFHELVEYLILKSPQYATARGGFWGCALHSASFAGHLQIVRSLLRHGVVVDVRDYDNCTPLTYTSIVGHRDVVQCLLEHGANVDLPNHYHITPLMRAASFGHVDVVRLLLEHSADVHSQDRSGRTPLHAAMEYFDGGGDYPRVVRLLLEYGANPNARDTNRRTPLHILLENDKLDVLQLLLEYGADVNAEDMHGKTPLQMSLELCSEEVTQLLSRYSGRE